MLDFRWELAATIMKQYFIITTLAILSSIFVYGQTNSNVCNCPKNEYVGTKSDTIFYKDPDSKQTNYSEFVLAACGKTKIIDFWDGTETCYLKVKKDTLLVDKIVILPIGNRRTYKATVWATHKIFFVGQSVVKTYSVNKNIPKYHEADIAKTLKEYDTSKGSLSDEKMELANRLFIATISGKKKARKYFREFRTRFGELDGAFSEEYRDLSAMLSQWDGEK
jgi:hypothetical protein